MGSLLNIESKFFQGVTKIGNLVILNLLFLFSCLPVITIGASLTALYTVTLKMAVNKEAYVVKSYFKAWKENWKQSTLIWLALLGILAVLILDANLCLKLQGSFVTVLAILIRIFLLMWIMVFSYVFAVQAQFSNTIRGTFKNAFVMSAGNLLPTVVIVFLNCLPLMFLFFSYNNLVFIIGLYTWIGFAGIAFLNSTLFNRIFHKYIPEEDEELEEI